MHVVEQRALARADVTRGQVEHVFAHAILADVHAAAQDLDHAVRREQVGDVVVARLVDVVTADAGDILELVDVAEPLDLELRGCDCVLELDDLSVQCRVRRAGIARGAREREQHCRST